MERYKQKFTEKSPKIIKHVLTGIHDYAKTFGIMTAENPMGLKLTRKENIERNKEFYELLKELYYNFVD